MNNTVVAKDISIGLPVWLRGSDEVVMSTTVVLHRNISGFLFPHKERQGKLLGICDSVIDKAESLPGSDRLSYSFLSDMPSIAKGLIFERRMCDSVLYESTVPMVVFVSGNGEVAIHVNSSDHLEISVSKPGFSVVECLRNAKIIADRLKLSYAKSSEFGYLTSMPALMGTGLDIRLKMYLPALVVEDESFKWITECKSKGLLAAGFFGRDENPYGDLYVFRNQNTHRKTESDLIDTFETVKTKLRDLEMKSRGTWDKQESDDAIYRAYGTFKYVRQITFAEAMSGLSLIRFGVETGVLSGVSRDLVLQLISDIFPTALLHKTGCPLDEINASRATHIRDVLSACPI